MKDSKFFNALIVVLVVFLASLTVLVSVMILNTAKESQYIGKSDDFQNTISVLGEGEVFVKPDMGMAVFTVSNENKDVREALNEKTNNFNRLVEFMKESGIEEKDMKTINFIITPRYEYPEADNFFPGRRVLAGYQATQSLEVKVRDIDKMGIIVQGAVNAGANEVTDIRFVVENEEEYRNESRALAVGDAKLKAEKLADKLGVELVRITHYSENEGPIVFDMMRAEAVGMGGPAPDIQTGENLIRTVVTINYEIK